VYIADAACVVHPAVNPRDLGGVVEISRRATEYNQYRIPARDENKSRGTIIIKCLARLSPTFARGLLIYLLLSREIDFSAAREKR